MKKWKHGILPNDIITFNEESKFLSTLIMELVNIDKFSHRNAVVISITKKDFRKTEYNYVTEDDDGNIF